MRYQVRLLLLASVRTDPKISSFTAKATWHVSRWFKCSKQRIIDQRRQEAEACIAESLIIIKWKIIQKQLNSFSSLNSIQSRSAHLFAKKIWSMKLFPRLEFA